MIGLSISRGYPIENDPSRVYYGTDTRAFTMLIGAVLAMVWAPWRLSDKTTRGGRLVLDALGVVGILGLAWMFLNVSEFSNNLYRGGFLICSLLSAMVIAVTVHPAADLGRWFLGRQPHALDRRALLRDLPLALARVHDHPAGRWTSA